MNLFVPLSHCRYSAYLSKEQVAEIIAPHPDTLDLVNCWLRDHGIPPSSVSITLGGNWLVVIGVPVPQANNILGASYQLYQHVEANETVLRTVSYSLPEALYGHIQTVAPTTYFGSPLTQGKKPRIRSRRVAVERGKVGSKESVRVLPSREEFVTPAYVRSLYKTLGYVPAAADRNAIGIAGYLKEYPSLQDLRAFMEEFRTDGEDATFIGVQLNGATYDPKKPGFEANLDLQFSEAMTYPTTNIYYSTGGVSGTATDPYLKWLSCVGTDQYPTDNQHVIQQQRVRGSARFCKGVVHPVRTAWPARRQCPLLDRRLGRRRIRPCGLFGPE
jgi:tripeptidyl-peptidase-1